VPCASDKVDKARAGILRQMR